MIIPEVIKTALTMTVCTDAGMAVYHYRDTLGLGICVEVSRESREDPFTYTWRLDRLPGRRFGSLFALRMAAAELCAWPNCHKPDCLPTCIRRRQQEMTR